MQSVNIYFNFPGNTEEAFHFYRSVFGGEFLQVVRFRDFKEDGMGARGSDLDKIAHISLPLGEGCVLMGTDSIGARGQSLTRGNDIYVTLSAENADEARRLFDGLSDGGTVEMPLSRVEWSELYGSCIDRFGKQWMVDYTGSVTFGPPG